MAGGDASFLGTLNATRTAFYFFFFLVARRLKPSNSSSTCYIFAYSCFFFSLCFVPRTSRLRLCGTMERSYTFYPIFTHSFLFKPFLHFSLHVFTFPRARTKKKKVCQRGDEQSTSFFFFSELIFTLVHTSFILSSHCSFLIR